MDMTTSASPVIGENMGIKNPDHPENSTTYVVTSVRCLDYAEIILAANLAPTTVNADIVF